MKLTAVTPIQSAQPTPAAPPMPAMPVLIDHDGEPVEAPCTSRYCPPGHHDTPVIALPVTTP